MKKMRNGRRGFTLLEIVIVVAIIVILSTGAFLGVAATVNRASDAQARLEANNGENFEAYARNQVDSYGKNMVYWDPIPNYTPENQAKKMKEQMLAEGWTDGEITFEYQSDGWHIVAEWDPTLDEHRGFQTPEDYKLWLSNYNNYIALGYSAEEIEDGCKNGSTDIKPVWDASKHGGVSEEDYLKQKQGGGSSGGGQQGGNQQGGNQQGGNQQGGQQGGNQQGGNQQGGSGTSITVGNVTAPVIDSSSYQRTGNGGVVNSITGSGNTQTITMTSLDGYNAGQIGITITKTSKGYTCSIDKGNYIFVGNLKNAGWGSGSFNLEASDIKWLEDNYGIKLS